MQIHDISVPVHERMITYEGDPEVRLELVSAISEGAAVNVTRLALGAHAGTHVDAPVHFLADGSATEAMPLDVLIGEAYVVDASDVDDALDEPALRRLDLPRRAERILFKTANGRLWERNAFSHDFVSLRGDGARYLVERGVRLVGIDYLSIGDEEAHRALLGAGVVPLEGLDLRRVGAGVYRLVCLPLKLVGSDGAPARAVLIREDVPS